MMQSITSTEEKTRKDQALKNLKDNPPRDDTQFLLQAEQLAAWYAEHKQYEVSAELNKRILERCDKNPDLGTNNASAVRAAYNRAFALQQLDLYSDSEQMYRLAITGRQARTKNEDDPSVLNARMQLAEVLYLRSQFAEAERELEDVRNRSSTEDRKTVLDCQASLGFLFQRLERWEDSKSLLEPTFQEMKLQLGPTDGKTLLTQHRLAFVLQSLDHNDTSETLYRDLLQKRMQKNGAANYDTLIIMRDLAHVLQKRGDLPGAEALCEKASSGLKKLFPAGHVDIGWTDSSLARIRRDLDRLNQA
ncbi:hypothetical protein DL98DRAFT_221150 [Cadophora sp. DSE1049]|nr:hypothetical protein DL98DRAFT_221150 [Cadophora sp. DSE1049]